MDCRRNARNVPDRAITNNQRNQRTWRRQPSRRTVSDDSAAESEGDRRALADLDRRLARWKHRYPDLEVESVAIHGTLIEYLAYNRRSVELVIVGAHNRQHLKELIGPVGSAILQDADCSLLIVKRQHL